jgi:hypothetical protein
MEPRPDWDPSAQMVSYTGVTMKIRFSARITGSILAAFVLGLALATACWCQNAVGTRNQPKCLIVLPSAFDVKYKSVEGATQLVYKAYLDYPAESAIKTISEKLQREGWKPLESDFWNPSIPSSLQKGWQQFEDQTTKPVATVNQWMAQWRNTKNDIVSYTLEYRYPADANPDLNSLRVFAILIPASIAEKMPKTSPK